ncbi:MAG: DEAD/DEAH box helicase [Oscillospiraceae bacterium]|jgi:ATP-dependent DNA helicase RecQ|nr:DEAD/DEAH box helicase [Oscillospiraceae bacterium]
MEEQESRKSIGKYFEGVVKGYIEKKTAPDTLFVLKGYSLDALGLEQPGLHNVIDGKLAMLMALARQECPIISFDAFVCLYNLLLEHFRKIYIIESPLYHNIYPVGTPLAQDISEALLAHFNDDAGEDTPICALEEYTNVYSNYIHTPQDVACCYNITESQLLHEKIERHRISVPGQPLPLSEAPQESFIHTNLCDDTDYFALIQQLQTTQGNFAVAWDNFAAGKEAITKALEKLCACYPGRLFQAAAPDETPTDASNDEMLAMMKKYWGYDSFRQLDVYDLSALKTQEKKVVSVSQGQIVNDLIQQTENCIQGKDFRDVFVTASTGAGKSLMFQLPAIYLAEKYNLVTLVISPLIGLMKDQVEQLKVRGYPFAKTINGDISPVIKQEILEDVKNGKCHILYLSPESLLARSDIEMLIGTRRIGMVVVDEAHIVTTWGKQFRPDYWFLGDHVQKILQAQMKRPENPHGFVIATFTATAIYKGEEDMYSETLNSLHMNDPITYLGYVRRKNIHIEVSEVEVKKNKVEYELNKFDALIDMIHAALARGQKTLIYFPTVTLISSFHGYCYSKNLGKYVAKYHGQLMPEERSSNFQEFQDGAKPVMLATKAFGMGIDIKDIAIVAHFAPTGNVCDYMQEIGRAARDSSIDGHAIYRHMSNDFKHINRLHGLSTIQKYQLIRVMGKILEIFEHALQGRRDMQTKRRNEMLIDTESFAYIFEGPGTNHGDENELINKVKTALLLIQKDYTNQWGFSPFHMRPIPLFAKGFFAISPQDIEKLNKAYPGAATVACEEENIYDVNLEKIWKRSYYSDMSFPRFKFMLYTGKAELDLTRYHFTPAMAVDIFFNANYEQTYEIFMQTFKRLTNDSARSGGYISMDDIVLAIGGNRYQAEATANVVLAVMDIFQRNYSSRMNAQIMQKREAHSTGKVTYHFDSSIRDFFTWLEDGYRFVRENIKDEKVYVVNDGPRNRCKEITVILGILESARVLRFRSLGGSQSQIYLRINSTKTLQAVRDKPGAYNNRLLELIEQRHVKSVQMLTFLFQSGFSNEQIWDYLEDYFLGIEPEQLQELPKKDNRKKKKAPAVPLAATLCQGEAWDCASWAEYQKNYLPDYPEIGLLDSQGVPFAEQYGGLLKTGETALQVLFAWESKHIVITDGDENTQVREQATQSGWHCIPQDELKASELAKYFER